MGWTKQFEAPEHELVTLSAGAGPLVGDHLLLFLLSYWDDLESS